MSQPPIVFDFSQTGAKEDDMGRKIYTHALFEPGTSPSRPLYSSTFGEDEHSGEIPALWLSSCPGRDLRNQHQVCKAVYHDDGDEIDVTHPWRAKGRINPSSPWGSDTGTLSGVPLQWVYNWQDHSGRDQHAATIVRCQYKDDERREVCRVTFHQSDQGKKSLFGSSGSKKGKLDHGRIEIPAGVITSQAGMDEMVSNACVQLHLRRLGWDPISKAQQEKEAQKFLKLVGKIPGLG